MGVRVALVVCALLAAACSGSGTEASVAADPATTAPAIAVPSATAAPTATLAPTAEPTATAAALTAVSPTPPPSEPTVAPSPTTPLSPTPTAEIVDTRCVRVVDFASLKTDWFVVNDGVMGGLSQGTANIDEGRLSFQGTINTNGGGFSSVRSVATGSDFAAAETLQVRLQTELARSYEFIVDVDNPQLERRVSYFGKIETAGGTEPQEVEVTFADFEPRIFGTPVDAPPIMPEQISGIGIILADGIDGDFALQVEWIDACA